MQTKKNLECHLELNNISGPMLRNEYMLGNDHIRNNYELYFWYQSTCSPNWEGIIIHDNKKNYNAVINHNQQPQLAERSLQH